MVYPMGGFVVLGGSTGGDAYSASFGSDPAFGPGGGLTLASSSTGETAGVVGDNNLVYVSANYTSGSLTTDSATWDNATLASLGITPGTYTWTFGSGADTDSIVLDVVAPPAVTATPEPAALPLLGIGLGVLALARLGRHKARCAL